MYWLVNTYTSTTGNKYFTYNYFEVVPVNDYKKPWYNGVQKRIIYPTTQQLIIKAIIVESEEDFLKFYNKMKKL